MSSEPAPASYHNWQAYLQKRPLFARVEIPVYSDAEFSLPPTDGWGPYRFQHAFPAEQHDPALILFVEEHYRPEIKMDKTETGGFTGTALGDELAALLSLSLGRRFMAGDATRILSPPTASEWIITADRSRPMFFRSTATRRLGQRALRLPRAAERLDVRVDLIATFARVFPTAATALVRAARLYRDALWIAETEPELAWLLLVSALEVAAVHYQAQTPIIDVLRASKPKLVRRLEGIEPSLPEEVAEHFSRELRATARFLAFVMKFFPEPPLKRPPKDWAWARVEWTSDAMKTSLKKIYDLRSRALHEGTPFPPPMSEPPHFARTDWEAPSETIIGLAAASTGGVWTADDLPMSLHTFEFVARGALLKWWSDIVSSEGREGADHQ
jgi:hypothetical protein